MPSAAVQTVAPLPSSGNFTSTPQFAQRAVSITGTVFADKAGTLKILQGGDGVNFDSVTTYNISANVGFGFEVDLLSNYWQVVYVNTNSPQTVFRLFASPRDPYGAFLQASNPPSPGGAYAVLQANSSGGYSYVGRFDGFDGWTACQNAAIFTRTNAKYAAFDVSLATVSDETILETTEHSPDSF